jgi:hypothetical protein
MANYNLNAVPESVGEITVLQGALNRVAHELDTLHAKLGVLEKSMNSVLRASPPQPAAQCAREVGSSPMGERLLQLRERTADASDFVQSLIDRHEI